MSIEQQYEYFLETELLLERYGLSYLFKQAQAALEEFNLNPTTRNEAILDYRSDAFNREYFRVYGDHNFELEADGEPAKTGLMVIPEKKVLGDWQPQDENSEQDEAGSVK